MAKKTYTYHPKQYQAGTSVPAISGVNPVLNRIATGALDFGNRFLNTKLPFVSNPTNYTQKQVLNADPPITEEAYNEATYMRPTANSETDFSAGDSLNERLMNFAYNNPALLNMAIKTPFVGDMVIDQVKGFMGKSGGSSVYNDKHNKDDSPTEYTGSFNTPVWAEGRSPDVTPINQLFTNDDLYQRANTYNADLAYGDFMPYYSAKGTEFDANIDNDRYTKRRIGMGYNMDDTPPSEDGQDKHNIFRNELAANVLGRNWNNPNTELYGEMPIPPADFTGGTDKEYADWLKLDSQYQEDRQKWEENIQNVGIQEFLKNKNTLTGRAYERPDINRLMGVDYGASRVGFGFTDNLPFMSVADPWDFQGIGRGGYGDKWESGRGLIQSQLVQQAAGTAKGDTPGFGFYDRLYFHPEMNEQGGFEYIKDKDLDFFQDYYSPETNRLDEVVITAPRKGKSYQDGGIVTSDLVAPVAQEAVGHIAKRAGAPLLARALPFLSPMSAQGGQMNEQQLKDKYGFIEFGGDGGPLPNINIPNNVSIDPMQVGTSAMSPVSYGSQFQDGGSVNPWQSYITGATGDWNTYQNQLNTNQLVHNEIVKQAEIRDKADDDWDPKNHGGGFGEQYWNLRHESRPDIDYDRMTGESYWVNPFTNPSTNFIEQGGNVQDWMNTHYGPEVENEYKFPWFLNDDDVVNADNLNKKGANVSFPGPFAASTYDPEKVQQDLQNVKAYEAFANATTKPELRKAMENLPPEMKDFMTYDESGLYNTALLGNDPVNFPSGLDPERALYCTPAGCNVTNNALTELGLPNIPTFYNNNAFVDYMGGPNSPFEVVSNPQPGDMVSNFGSAPIDYATNPTMVYRPHHTGIVKDAGVKTFEQTGTNEQGGAEYDFVPAEGGGANYYDPWRNESAESRGIPVPTGPYQSGVGEIIDYDINPDQSYGTQTYPYVNMYQARGGDQFDFGAEDVSLYSEDPIFYRYTGGAPGMKSNLLQGLEENIQYAPQDIQDQWNAEGANKYDILNQIFMNNTPTKTFKKGGHVPKMQGGGFLSNDWWQRQNWGGGNQLMRQNHRLGQMQVNSGINAGTQMNMVDGAVTTNRTFTGGLTGRDALKQQRLAQKGTNLGVDFNAMSVEHGAPLSMDQMKNANKAARAAKNAKFASVASPIIGGIGDMVPGMIAANAQTSASGETVDVGNAALSSGIGMAAQGAQMGMALGPIGAAVGAVVGGVGGALFGKSQAEKKQREIIDNKEKRTAANLATGLQQNQVNAAKVLSQYPTQGLDDVSYFAKFGGMIPTPDYQVEGGEVMMAADNNPPRTDKHGNVQQIGMNMFKFQGDTHDAKSGGIGVKGGNTEFASQTNQVLESGFVFSNRLKPSKDYLSNV